MRNQKVSDFKIISMESAPYKLETVFNKNKCRSESFMFLKSPCIPIPSLKYQTEGSSKKEIINIQKKVFKIRFFYSYVRILIAKSLVYIFL